MSIYTSAMEANWPSFKALLGETVTYTPSGSAGVSITAVLRPTTATKDWDSPIRETDETARALFSTAETGAAVTLGIDTITDSSSNVWVVASIEREAGYVIAATLKRTVFGSLGAKTVDAY